MEGLAEGVELLNRLVERRQDDFLHLGRVVGDGGELRVHFLEAYPRLVLVGHDGFAISRTHVTSER